MQSPHCITIAAFQMKFLKLFFLAALSATMLTGCERQFVSPIDPPDPSQTAAQLAQKALSDLADTAAERGFVDLANAASDVAEGLAIETGTTTEMAFLELVQEAEALQVGFASASCGITLREFAIASRQAAHAYVTEATIEPSDTEQVLKNLAQEALNAETLLQQFPAENPFIPFAFGYAPDTNSHGEPFYVPDPNPGPNPSYEPGVILIQYDATIRPVTETRAAVIDLLTNKGYTVTTEGVLDNIESVYLGEDVDIFPIMEELITIRGVAVVQPNYLYYPTVEPEILISPAEYIEVINRVRTRYNKAWCQGNFDVIDSILIEESGVDFFDYSFVRKLADIYAEEIPEAAEHIRTNGFALRSIASEFLGIYFGYWPRESHEWIIERFRIFIREGIVDIEHSRHRVCIGNMCSQAEIHP